MMMKRTIRLGGLAMLLLLAGCRSKYVAAVVLNNSGADVKVVEVDYPSASFGTDVLAAGKQYDYRFKILGSGPTKVQWMDGAGKQHSVDGPRLEEGEEGALVVTLKADGTAVFDPSLRH